MKNIKLSDLEKQVLSLPKEPLSIENEGKLVIPRWIYSIFQVGEVQLLGLNNSKLCLINLVSIEG
jgi:hypothetical protein